MAALLKIFAGKTRVCCGGWILIGPDICVTLITLLCITVPFVVYIAFDLTWYIEKGYAFVPAILAVLYASSIFFFVKTAFMDPGFLPRQKSPLNSFDFLTQKFRDILPPKAQDLVLNGQPIRLKYCNTCNIYRPPRTVHCSICDNCVERFDHHCPWVGNCVGSRNYRNFYLFLLLISILCMGCLASSLVKLIIIVTDIPETETDLLSFLLQNVSITAFILLYSFISLCCVSCLLVFHTYLVFTNQTTYEQVKKMHIDNNPFDRGTFLNLVDILCRPARGPLIDRGKEFQEIYEPRTQDTHHNLDIEDGVVPTLIGHLSEMKRFDIMPEYTNGVSATVSNESGVALSGFSEPNEVEKLMGYEKVAIDAFTIPFEMSNKQEVPSATDSEDTPSSYYGKKFQLSNCESVKGSANEETVLAERLNGHLNQKQNDVLVDIVV